MIIGITIDNRQLSLVIITSPSLQVARDCRILIEVPERFGFFKIY